MDNFVNFLLDYYLWILGVLLIIIITIIGFLVDSSKKRKNKENLKKEKINTDSNLEEVKTVQSLPEENNKPVLESSNQPVQIASNNLANDIPQTIQNPVQNASDNVKISKEQSISEQKPHFEPKEVNIPVSPKMPSQINYYNQQPIMQNPTNVQPQNVSNFAPRPVSPISINNENPQVNNNLANSTYMQNAQVNPYNMQGNVNNYTQKPVNQVPVQPIPNPAPQTVTTIPNQPQQNNQTMQVPNVGINFVTGDNNEEDKWKL